MGYRYTEKENLFCIAYSKHGSALQAYKDAGYKVKNDNVAGVEGWKLLHKPKISLKIREISEKIQNERIMTVEEMQERLTTIARSDAEKTQDRARAMELLAKLSGALLPKSESTDISINVNLSDL